MNGSVMNGHSTALPDRDFRSDTVTVPTEELFAAAKLASKGDAMYDEDLTTIAFERRIAKLTGKEAALFVPSGTMANQIAVRTLLTKAPHSVVTDARAHIYRMEAGGLSFFSQATVFPVIPRNGQHLTREDIEPHLDTSSAVFAIPTKLICLENPMQGVIHPQEAIVGIRKLADEYGLAMHCDGARIWHVLAEEIESRGLSPHNEDDRSKVMSELLAPFDTAALCLSKGIGAPVGSVLVGSGDCIQHAKRYRKLFGGGMRQTGILTSMANVSIDYVLPKLARVHDKARRLAASLQELGCDIVNPVHTNIVTFDTEPLGYPMSNLWEALTRLEEPIKLKRRRCVIHYQTSDRAIVNLIECVRRLKKTAETPGRPHERAKRDAACPPIDY